MGIINQQQECLRCLVGSHPLGILKHKQDGQKELKKWFWSKKLMASQELSKRK